MPSTAAILATTALSLVATAATASVTQDAANQPMRFESSVITVSPTLAKAAEAWSGPVTFRVVPADEAQITERATFLPNTVGGVAHREFAWGYWNRTKIERCVVDLDPRDDAVNSPTLLPILTHEVGHCLGLGHEHVRAGSVMHWFAKDYANGWSDTVTEYDRNLITNLYTEKD